MADILVVEDEKLLNEAYVLVLSNQGHKVGTAFNGEEALKKTTGKNYDLILLDLRMPKMDGVEFLKRYNPKKDHPKTKIIIFSNYDDQDEVNQAMENGATRYILKAWSSPKELIKLVKDTLAGD
jgi:two-component system, NtrC family, nitrogen regulation response regulator NtrX